MRHDQHGAFGVVEHRLGRAAQKRAGEPILAVGAHHDQVDLLRGDCRENDAGRLAFGDDRLGAPTSLGQLD